MIFMDIFMPVMDGVEAASKINALGTGTPIVAMTANVMTSELDNYKKSGMSDCVGKPFTTQELWRCLLKYLSPVSISVMDEQEQAQDHNELQHKLRVKFVKDNQTKYAEIAEALAAGDTTLAHRLAHTLKGNAGQIGEITLQNAAAEIEALLKAGNTQIEYEKMSLLRSELASVLEGLKPLLTYGAVQAEPINLNSEQERALLDTLELMLDNINPECINLLDEIRAVPGTETLAQEIEDYEFESASQTLAILRKNRKELDVSHG